jgi:hypothetical protein
MTRPLFQRTTARRPSLLRTMLAATVLVANVPCGVRSAFSQPVPPETALAAITGSLTAMGTDAPRLFSPPEPRRLRPCCAFGGAMKVKVLGIPLPCYRHQPLRGAADIGPHEYDPGLLQILPSPIEAEWRAGHDGSEHPKREHNGMVYTCRGGFLDTAHIRDFADLAWFLGARVEERLETGGTIVLADYGGRRRVTIRPVPPERIREVGRTTLAIAVAARLAFDLSVWREIATWYGYESVPPWSEKLSSFSPEDLYSNLLGTKLAEGILRTTAIHDRREWDLAMTAWLGSALDALDVVPIDAARKLMESLDGTFWSSARRIPDWEITLRRRFDRGPVVAPLTAHAKTSSAPCWADDAPLLLAVQDDRAGVSLGGVAEIDVVVSDRLVKRGFPLPRGGDRRVVEADFDGLIETVRRATTLSASPP